MGELQATIFCKFYDGRKMCITSGIKSAKINERLLTGATMGIWLVQKLSTDENGACGLNL